MNYRMRHICLLSKTIGSIVFLSLAYSCTCSSESAPSTGAINDSIDSLAIIDTVFSVDSIATDTIAIDSIAVDSTIEENLPEFEPSTVVDMTKKGIKDQLISINEMIDKASADLKSDSISTDQAINIGKTAISMIDSISKGPKGDDFKNQIKAVTRRANKLIEIASPNIDKLEK